MCFQAHTLRVLGDFVWRLSHWHHIHGLHGFQEMLDMPRCACGLSLWACATFTMQLWSLRLLRFDFLALVKAVHVSVRLLPQWHCNACHYRVERTAHLFLETKAHAQKVTAPGLKSLSLVVCVGLEVHASDQSQQVTHPG